MSKENLVWHYSKMLHVDEIFESGIKPSDTFMLGQIVVWFSTNQEWEKSVGPDRDFLHEASNLIRFGVKEEVAPHDVDAFIRLTGSDQEMREILVETGKVMGADPREWRVSFETATRDQFEAFEVWDADNDRWVRIDGKHWPKKKKKRKRLTSQTNTFRITLPTTQIPPQVDHDVLS